MMSRLHTLRSKLLCGILAIVILPVCILGIWGYQISKKAVLEQSEAAILSQLKQVGSAIENRLDQMNRYSKLVIFSADIQRLIQNTELTTKSRYRWNETRELYRFFCGNINDKLLVSAGIVRLKGGLYQYADQLGLSEEALREKPWLQKAVESRGAAVWVMDGDYLVLARLIRDSAYQFQWSNIGVVYFYISPDVFWTPISQASQKTHWSVVDAENQCMLSTQGERIPDLQIPHSGEKTVLLKRQGSVPAFSAYRFDSPSWLLVQKTPERVGDSISALWLNAFVLCACSFILAVVCISLCIRSITNPLTQLQAAIQSVGFDNRMDARLSVLTNDEIGYIGRAFNAMLERIRDLMLKTQQEENQRHQVELKMLQYQINPHFLYNALNSIRIMALLRKEQAIADSAAALSHLMQAAIGKFGETVTLSMELATVRDYLLIQNNRLDHHLTLHSPEDEVMQRIRVPNFILQPLVENAVFHGIIPKDEDGTITIAYAHAEDQLVLTVEDDGIGIPENLLNLLVDDSDVSTNRCIGLRNVNRRIKIACGIAYGLTLHKTDSGGTCVVIHLPWEEEHVESTSCR